ncbi:MAG: hypothetical protein C4325_13900 [Blastocatellia bacterium]
MKSGFYSIPFKTSDEHGIKNFTGVAKLSIYGIVLEFESKWFGLIRDDLTEARLPLAEILDIRLRRGFFGLGGKIEIRTRTFAALASLPNKNGRIRLKIHREDLREAKVAVGELQKAIDEYSASLPPPHSQLSDLFQTDTGASETDDRG